MSGAVRRGRRPLTPAPRRRRLPRQLDVDELARRVTGAPSRAGMARPKPKADYLQHLWTFYNALWRRARADRTAAFDTSWGQLRVACGYPDTVQAQTSLERYAAALAELGLARIGGVHDRAGAWQRLDVELLAPPAAGGTIPRKYSSGEEWRRHDLTHAERRLTAGRPRAGRLARRRELETGIRRIYRRRNLGTPLGLGSDYVLPQPKDRERDARRRRPGPTAAAAIESTSIDANGGRARQAEEGPRRFAALNRLRTAATEEDGPERLRQAVRSGASPCSVAVAAFEARFVRPDHLGDPVWDLGDFRQSDLELADDRRARGLDPRSTPTAPYRTLGARWADRLEAACRIHDRATGEVGSGLLSLLDDLLSWHPEDGAPHRRHDGLEDLGAPASLAYFVKRLGVRARQLRAAADPARQCNRLDHADRPPDARARRFQR